MLAGSFFKMNHTVIAGEKLSTVLHLLPSHEIFKGHFPGMPVVPGVCMVEMMKEILEEVVGKKTKMKKAGNIKFLHVLDPNAYPEIEAELKIKESENTFIVQQKSKKEIWCFLKWTQCLLLNKLVSSYKTSGSVSAYTEYLFYLIIECPSCCISALLFTTHHSIFTLLYFRNHLFEVKKYFGFYYHIDS